MTHKRKPALPDWLESTLDFAMEHVHSALDEADLDGLFDEALDWIQADLEAHWNITATFQRKRKDDQTHQ